MYDKEYYCIFDDFGRVDFRDKAFGLFEDVYRIDDIEIMTPLKYKYMKEPDESLQEFLDRANAHVDHTQSTSLRNHTKNDNAYRTLKIMPYFKRIDENERTDIKYKLSWIEQALKMPPDDMSAVYSVLAEFGKAAGQSSELFEVPLRKVFEKLRAAEVYTGDDYVVINGVEQTSGGKRKIFTKKEAKELDGKHIVIPAGYTEIGSDVFHGWWSLSAVTIPEGVNKIGKRAFRDCRALVDVNIPESVVTIGSEAFRDCRLLSKVTIPESVTKIGSKVFLGCDALIEVVFPDSVTKIADDAFSMSRKEVIFSSSEDLTIVCRENSYAHQFAQDYNFKFKTA